MNSPSGTSTVDPDGTAAATYDTSAETWLPIATVDAGTCTSRANEARALAMTAS